MEPIPNWLTFPKFSKPRRDAALSLKGESSMERDDYYLRPKIGTFFEAGVSRLVRPEIRTQGMRF
jgi:hypothetical protein